MKKKLHGLRHIAPIVVIILRLNAQSPLVNLEAQAKAKDSEIRGTVKLAGLQHSVSVIRDRWGVAHIYAQNQHDLFFAQGFVVAQDRLFQMELWKRSGQGRLAEVLGPDALPRDINARLLRYRGNMQSEFESYSPDTKEILEDFVAGINAYIADRLRPEGSGVPVEFQIAGFTPEPWKPEDCLNRMAAFSMTGNAFTELVHAQLVAALGAEKASQLFSFDPPVKLDPAAGVDFFGLSPRLLHSLVGSDSRIEFPAYYVEGSNNWAISGRLTQSGKPLLANDPHRVLAEPSLRYIVHLVAPGWDVIGAGEPGLPGVALGHNQQIAWGFTIFGSDQQDLYIEELNPANPLQYRGAFGWERMEVQKERFQIHGGPAVTVELKFTRHGPVLWEDGKRALALRWVGSEPGTAGYLGSLAVDRARNWDEFEAALKRWKLPSENMVYADRDGNIGEWSVGLTPLRENWTGLLPVPGTGRYEWTGFVPINELPHSFNPPAGFVASANQKMIPAAYPYRIGYEWEPPYRFRRITEVLERARMSGSKLTGADMERLQNDVVSIPGRELVNLLRASRYPPDAQVKMLQNWDGLVSQESGAAALYVLWLEELTVAVMHRVAPKSTWNLLDPWEPDQVLGYLSNPRRAIFGSDPGAERDRLLIDSLKLAAERLSKLEGPEPSKWSWGNLHVAKFRHPLARTPGAQELMNLGPVARPGDGYTVNATEYSSDSFEQVAGASYREILDLNDWDKSVAVNVPGQSGQPGSPHYGDLLEFWSEGKYFPLSYSSEAVRNVTIDKLVLEP